MCMGVLPTCMSALCAGSTCGGQDIILDVLGLELHSSELLAVLAGN